MNVLSLFDGMSCGQIALNRAGIKYDNYFASEIKSFAINHTQKKFPNTIQVGDVCKLHYENDSLYSNCEKICDDEGFIIGWKLGNKIPNSKIDILIGGSPCQNFSSANAVDRRGLEGDKSRLFYEYLRLKREINPKYFLLENVKMSKENEQKLNEFMEINGVHIDSKLLTFQKRERIYWTNINNGNIPQPIDKNILFKDYVDNDTIRCEEARVNKTPSRLRMWNDGLGRTSASSCENITNADKIGCLTRKQDRCPNSGLIAYKDFCRFLTRRELEMAQTIPIGFLDDLSFKQVQDVTGDGWTIDVIAHILKNI
jgi:site-specific DNA-cytosine methylase